MPIVKAAEYYTFTVQPSDYLKSTLVGDVVALVEVVTTLGAPDVVIVMGETLH